MVDRLKKFLNWIEAFSTSLIGVLSFQMIGYLREQSDRIGWVVFLVIAIVFALSRLIHAGAKWSINNMVFLRKFIMQKEFVEGRWIDFVKDQKGIRSVAIINIAYDSSSFLVNTGQIFSLEGEEIGSFRSFISTYSKYKMKFSYAGTSNKISTVDTFGFGEYTFLQKTKGSPDELSGFLYDTHYKKKLLVIAKKVSRDVKLNTIDEKRNFIKRFIIENDIQSNSEK